MQLKPNQRYPFARCLRGRSTTANGALGVGRAFLIAGTGQVVAAAWNVDDAASATLFNHFHRRFLQSGDAAESLRFAQLAAIESTNPADREPRKWAPFVVMARDIASRVGS